MNNYDVFDDSDDKGSFDFQVSETDLRNNSYLLISLLAFSLHSDDLGTN